jgi:beta-glucanase (GH16 family)
MVSFKLSSVIALALVGSAINVNAAAIGKRCESFTDTFNSKADVSQKWGGMIPSDTYTVNGNGLEMKVLNPKGKSKSGDGPTFISNMVMQYGYVEAKIKAAPLYGLVTSFILRAPNGDEIDWEWVGPTAQTAYYYHGIEDYNTGDSIVISDESTNYHTYGIDWQPDYITWYVDGAVHRTVTKASTNENGVDHYPTEAAHVELGLWDASFNASTAAWAYGPIDWAQQPAYISAYVEYVKVSC